MYPSQEMGIGENSNSNLLKVRIIIFPIFWNDFWTFFIVENQGSVSFDDQTDLLFQIAWMRLEWILVMFAKMHLHIQMRVGYVFLQRVYNWKALCRVVWIGENK